MRISFLICILFVVGTSVSAQKFHDPIAAQNHIKALKSSVLMVRLQSRSVTIEALKKRGLDQQAENIIAEQKEKNLEIVKAFQSDFDFCHVYFFYSDDSKVVLEKKWSEVSFLNEKLETDSQIKFEGGTFYVAEFAQIDTRVDKTQGTPELSFQALIIKDSEFNQLTKPFPYYVRSFRSFPFKKKPSKVVKKMNVQLKEFYG